MMPAPLQITLRPVERDDLVHFHRHQLDLASHRMAAFTHKALPIDPELFVARWTGFLADPTIVARTILASGPLPGTVAGHIARYQQDDEHHLTYWIERATHATSKQSIPPRRSEERRPPGRGELYGIREPLFRGVDPERLDYARKVQPPTSSSTHQHQPPSTDPNHKRDLKP